MEHWQPIILVSISPQVMAQSNVRMMRVLSESWRDSNSDADLPRSFRVTEESGFWRRGSSANGMVRGYGPHCR